MPRGPQHQRLADFIDNAHPGSLDDAATQWKTGMGLLRKISEELKTKAGGMKAAESYSDGDVWTGATASTAREAFNHSSTNMHDKSNEMEEGAAAFIKAADGIRDARTKLAALDQADPGDKPKPPTFSPGPRSHADEVKQQQYDTSATNWQRDYHANELAAQAAIHDLQTNHKEQSEVFRKIAGLPPREKRKPVVKNTDPVDTGTRPTTTHLPPRDVHGHIDNPNNNGGNDDPPNNNGGNDDPPPNNGGNDDPPNHNGGNDFPGGNVTPPVTGVPQGPTTTSPIGPLGAPSGAPGGAGAIGGVGAVAGGAFGGAAAAGLAGGMAGSGLSGIAPVGAGGRGNLSSSGVRGIGATSRAGVGSVLGRGTGTGAGGAGRAGAGGMATRNGGKGGGKGRSAAGRGSRGTAGARGAGAGAGAGRNGKDKKRSGTDRDLFDDGQDWLDDEAQPGLID